mmetsp:Transcript_4921/g.10912  ORF Transcript_4921/g.10912 Transcript_4921/m.10912 type:complete len:229 (-) Transcript_4921:6794-7480(-)
MRAVVLACAGDTQTGNTPSLNWHMISGTVRPPVEGTVLSERVRVNIEADGARWGKPTKAWGRLGVRTGRAWARKGSLSSPGRASGIPIIPADWRCWASPGVHRLAVPSAGGSKLARSALTKAAVTTYWAVQIWSREGSRPKPSESSPGHPVCTVGAAAGWWQRSASCWPCLHVTVAGSNFSGTGSTYCSESCTRMLLASSVSAMATAWLVTRSKTRAWKLLLRILARR